jgi:hypothetical protein
VLSEPAPRLVLLPFRLLIAPTLAPSIAAWLPAFAIAAGLLVLHYLWVQRSDASFEETAAAEGARVADALAAVRSGGRMRLHFTRGFRPARLSRPLLRLEPTGRAAYAIFWKNVLYTQRLFRRGTLVTVALIGVFMLSASLTMAERGLHAVAGLLFTIVGGVTVFGPFMFRNDLRMDLPFVELLRTYPVRGRDVVGAGVAASAACVTITQLVLLVVALTVAVLGGLIGALLAVGAALAALLVLPVVNTMAVLIQNAIALLFPAWTKLGAQGGGGMEAVGQNMLNLIASVVALVLVMILPAIAGALVVAPVAMQFGNIAMWPGAVATLAALALEAALIAHWLGGLYDNLDVVESELLR